MNRHALFLLVGLLLTCIPRVNAGVYAMIEARFDVPGVEGNPFDFTRNDVNVTLRTPSGTVVLPAFFDGTTWRVRHSPSVAGVHEIVTITRNGIGVTPNSIQPGSFDVQGDIRRGFIRVDPSNKFRFVHDDQSTYYPLGINYAWRNKSEPARPTIPDAIARMGSFGINWARIWMNHWDMKNLDWREDKPIAPGMLDMEVARQWDEILRAAEANDVSIQMALQHHGQYSTRADANWEINPWNKANGGWLESPDRFFTDDKARAITKSKYRYIIARYGYSPSILAWELFNEVEGTDAYESHFADVVAWHREMATFLREQDPYHHLITTSSRTTDAELWPAMDFYNPHVYAPDIVTAIQTLEAQKLDRAYFYGEIGAAAFGAQVNPVQTIHECLWASLMSQSSGAAQYWYWDLVEDNNLFPKYAAASAFLKQSGVLSKPNLRPIEVVVQTAKRAALRFGPGTGWGASKTTQFTARPTGFVDGIGGMSAYLQGTLNEKNKPMFPFMELKVNFPEPGNFSVAIDEITPSGAVLDVTVDGKPVSTLTLQPPPTGPAAPGDRQRRNPRIDTTLTLPIPQGEHLIRLENNGRDWVHLRQFTLSPYAPELAVLGKASSDYAVLWVYRREPGNDPIDGVLSVPSIAPGTYRVSYFDTQSGIVVRSEVIRFTEHPIRLATGPVQQDVAIWVSPTSDLPTTQPVP